MSEGFLQVSCYSTLDFRIRAIRAVLDDGLTVTDVAHAYGTNRSTIHRWLSRFAEGRDYGLHRCPVPDRPHKLASLDADTPVDIVFVPATAFGYETDFWTTRRLIQVVGDRFGVSLSKQLARQAYRFRRKADINVQKAPFA